MALTSTSALSQHNCNETHLLPLLTQAGTCNLLARLLDGIEALHS